MWRARTAVTVLRWRLATGLRQLSGQAAAAPPLDAARFRRALKKVRQDKAWKELALHHSSLTERAWRKGVAEVRQRTSQHQHEELEALQATLAARPEASGTAHSAESLSSLLASYHRGVQTRADRRADEEGEYLYESETEWPRQLKHRPGPGSGPSPAASLEGAEEEGGDAGRAEREEAAAVVYRCICHYAELAQEEYDRLGWQVDFRSPHHWYPAARRRRRHFVIHRGPTNSGKTHHAVQFIERAEGDGIFCAPLRLLAWEQQARLTERGHPTSLLTGQESETVPFARHLACTVEMADMSRRWDVCVLDECQFLFSTERGGAWTQVLLGVDAATVVCCEDGTATDTIIRLCGITGETYEVREFERMSPLAVEDTPVRGYEDIKEGDCIVGFGRRALFQAKEDLEAATKHKACLVYGSLPARTRQQQAKAFNDPSSPYTVLVATDAIGLGLNLNIRRVVFLTATKFDGRRMRVLQPGEIKQIAGRAGRRGCRFENGLVSTFNARDLAIVREGLAVPRRPPRSPQVTVNVRDHHIALYGQSRPELGNRLSVILRTIQNEGVTGPLFRITTQLPRLELAVELDDTRLKLDDKIVFSQAPVSLTSEESRAFMRGIAESLASHGTARLSRRLPHNGPAKDSEGLGRLELLHEELEAYIWLGMRIGGDAFVDLARAETLRDDCANLISATLKGVAGGGGGGGRGGGGRGGGRRGRGGRDGRGGRGGRVGKGEWRKGLKG